jgi:acetate CoA/acetoacetate CoA-transferase alpha subunit
MRRAITAAEAAALVPDGATVMIGGFMGVGTPERLIDALVARGAKDLTVVANDTARPGRGIGKLITANSVSRVITSHIGLNPETQRKMIDGTIVVELVPQGTLVERIRAGGTGLGGFYTPTGVGTELAEGKETRVIDGREYLFEKALKADFAFLKGHLGDRLGNLMYRGTMRNFNMVMATAAATVIAEVDRLVAVGEIPPEQVHTPGVFVDRVVQVERHPRLLEVPKRGGAA